MNKSQFASLMTIEKRNLCLHPPRRRLRGPERAICCRPIESTIAQRDQAQREVVEARRKADEAVRQREHEREKETARLAQLEGDKLRLRESMELARREIDATIAAIRAGTSWRTSWRITAPLRQIKRRIA